MSRACHGPVRMAVGDAFSDEEIDDIVTRLARRHREAMRAEPSATAEAAMREAAGEMTREQVRGELIQRRMELAAARARTGREARRAAMPELKPAEAQTALMVGTEKQVRGGARSTDATARALEAQVIGDVERGLRAKGLMDRFANDREWELAWSRELNRRNGGAEAPTGDADAEHVAQVIGAALDRVRGWQNDAGAWIAELPGYMGRQHHDALKVAGGFWRELGELRSSGLASWGELRARSADRAYATWRDFVSPLLDERTFDGVEDREAFLKGVWFNIVTGRHSILQGADDVSDLGGEFRPPASKARSVSGERVLHYRSAEAAVAYHRRFGAGSRASAVFADLQRGARNTALMRDWGPNPEAAFAADRERLTGAAREAGDVTAAEALASRKLDGAFEQLTGAGSAPESIRVSAIGRAIRANESLSKLGGMVLSSFADAPVAAQTLARGGVDFLQGYDGVLKGLARHPERKAVAELLDVGARATAGRVAAPFHSNDGFRGFQAWAMQAFYKVNGFNFWNDGVRAGTAAMYARHLGEEAKVGWGRLHPGTRETLERFGVDARGWELLRAGVREMDGGRYLTFDALDDADDAALNGWAGHKGKAATAETAARAREELGLRLRAMVGSIVDTATSEGGAREAMVMQPRVADHPVLTEALRMFYQFKAFPYTYVTRQLVPASRGYAGRKPFALMAHLILATTAMGYLSMQAKQLAKGRTLRPLTTEDGKLDGRPFIAALVQGGGLGIYGDFLFGEYNRFGGSAFATLGGPAVGDFEQVLKLFGMLRDGEETKRQAQVKAGFSLATSNTPFLNTWWTKAALDYALLWRTQEAISPGWAERHEENVRKSTGSRYWLKPTEAVR